MSVANALDRPSGIQLAKLGDVGAAENDSRSIRAGSDSVGNRSDARAGRHRWPSLGILSESQFIGRENTLLGDDDVGAETAELPAEFVFEVEIQGESRRRHGGHDGNGDERGEGTVFAHPGSFEQEARKEFEAAHASPRSTTAGSKRMALRTAPALPKKVTASAAQRISARTTGWTEIVEPKMLCPMRWARVVPARNPRAPPARARRPASARNRDATEASLAPMDFISPTSCRRSRT